MNSQDVKLQKGHESMPKSSHGTCKLVTKKRNKKVAFNNWEVTPILIKSNSSPKDNKSHLKSIVDRHPTPYIHLKKKQRLTKIALEWDSENSDVECINNFPVTTVSSQITETNNALIHTPARKKDKTKSINNKLNDCLNSEVHATPSKKQKYILNLDGHDKKTKVNESVIKKQKKKIKSISKTNITTANAKTSKFQLNSEEDEKHVDNDGKEVKYFPSEYDCILGEDDFFDDVSESNESESVRGENSNNFEDRSFSETSSDEHTTFTVSQTRKRKKRVKIKNSKIITVREDTALIILKQNSVIYMHGLATLQVICGAVEIFGYILRENSNEVDVFSPRGTSYLYIKSLESGSAKNIAMLNKHEIIMGFIDDIKKFTENPILVLCRRLYPPSFTFLERHISQKITPAEKCVFKEKPKSWNVFKIINDWMNIASKITLTSKVFVCGGKSVGKSTFVRYLINSLLRNFQEVCIIDLDPGQPEFTVPGCISSIIVKKPILGPNYSHLQTPDRCIFVSNIDIASEPNVYLLNVAELLSFSKDLTKIPTIINYMGYHKFLGVDMVSSVINLVQPTVVVQIESSDYRRNFENALNMEYVHEKSKTFSLFLNELSYTLLTIPSMVDNNKGWELSPRQTREMCILSYFSQNLGKNSTSILNGEIPVYIIKLSELKLRIENRNATLLEINASLVGLCALKNTFENNDVYICYGWGIVRAINFETEEIALITPLNLETLDVVDCLVLGSVKLPPSVFMSQKNVGLIGYVAEGELQYTSNIPKKHYFSKTHL